MLSPTDMYVDLKKHSWRRWSLPQLTTGGKGASKGSSRCSLLAFAAFTSPYFRFCIQIFQAIKLSLSSGQIFGAVIFLGVDRLWCSLPANLPTGEIGKFDKTRWCGYFDQRVAPINSISNLTKSLLAARDKSYQGLHTQVWAQQLSLITLKPHLLARKNVKVYEFCSTLVQTAVQVFAV